MIAKKFKITFANPGAQAIDHIQDIRKAGHVEHLLDHLIGIHKSSHRHGQLSRYTFATGESLRTAHHRGTDI